MKYIPLYSLVIFPTPEQSELIRHYKQLLKKEIGWFGSANAAAHITVINFDDKTAVSSHLQQINAFCKAAAAENVIFNRYDSFGERTFFISPDQPSQKYLDRLIASFIHHLGCKPSKIHAHLSIARGLDAQRMKIAYSLFKNQPIEFSFYCNAFHLRKFNEQTQQYSDIVQKFELKGKPQPNLFSN